MKEKYIKEVRSALKEKLGYKNDLAVPRIEKVVVNTGFNPITKGDKIQEELTADLVLITGQKPAPCQTKKAEASFKTRKGMIIGLVTTLRGRKMYDFLDRLVHVVLPRTRDFRGLPEKNIDKMGNFNIGIKEQIVFPEISAESARSIFGLEVSIVTTAKSHKEGVALFKSLGFPIKSK